MMRNGVWILLLLAASVGAGADISPAASATSTMLSVSIVPQQAATRLAHRIILANRRYPATEIAR